MDIIKHQQTASLIESGRQLFLNECKFVGSFNDVRKLPNIRQNEVAFAGRSNVGKSSIINALTGVRDMAKTSSTPGRTQSLNFFNMTDRIYIVDMPGYGFAKAPDKMVRNWTSMVFSYLRNRPNLRRVYLLIDSRHGIKPSDKDVMDMLDAAATSYQIVLTKIDKIKDHTPLIESTTKEISKHVGAYPEVIATSSETKEGIDYLKALISGLV